MGEECRTQHCWPCQAGHPVLDKSWWTEGIKTGPRSQHQKCPLPETPRAGAFRQAPHSILWGLEPMPAFGISQETDGLVVEIEFSR